MMKMNYQKFIYNNFDFFTESLAYVRSDKFKSYDKMNGLEVVCIIPD